MLVQKLSAIVIFAVLTFSASFAQTVLPDLFLSTATMAGVTTQTVSLFSVPNGTGLSLDEAQIYNDGATIDATITLVLMDPNNDPIANRKVLAPSKDAV